MPRLDSQLKVFIEEALQQRKYQNLSYCADGIFFKLTSPKKNNRNFEDEEVQIFKDWDLLRGKSYDRLKSKDRFISALRASYFLTDFKRDGPDYTCRFSSVDEIFNGRVEKGQRSTRFVNKSGSEDKSLERSPSISSSSALTTEAMQTEQCDRLMNAGSPDDEYLPPCTSDKELGTLKQPLGMNSTQGESQGNLHSTVESVINTDVRCSSGHGDTYVTYMNELLDMQKTALGWNNMEIISQKPGVDNPVFTGPSGNVDFRYQTTRTDVTVDSSYSANMQTSTPPAVMELVPNNYPAHAKMEESFSHNAPSILDIPPQSETFSEPAATLNNLHTNSACTMKEALNISMAFENVVPDDWISAALAHQSSPPEVHIGYGCTDNPIDFVSPPLFPENFEQIITEKLPEVVENSTLASSFNAACSFPVGQSSFVEGIDQGKSLELPQVEISTHQNGIFASSEAFSEDVTDIEVLYRDAFDICQSEVNSVLTAEADDLKASMNVISDPNWPRGILLLAREGIPKRGIQNWWSTKPDISCPRIG